MARGNLRPSSPPIPCTARSLGSGCPVPWRPARCGVASSSRVLLRRRSTRAHDRVSRGGHVHDENSRIRHSKDRQLCHARSPQPHADFRPDLVVVLEILIDLAFLDLRGERLGRAALSFVFVLSLESHRRATLLARVADHGAALRDCVDGGSGFLVLPQAGWVWCVLQACCSTVRGARGCCFAEASSDRQACLPKFWESLSRSV